MLIGGALALCWTAGSALAWDRGNVETLAVLPQGATGPEGIAVAPDGNVYVGTFGFTTTGPVVGPGKIYVYSDNGHLIRTLSVAGSTAFDARPDTTAARLPAASHTFNPEPSRTWNRFSSSPPSV